MGRGREKNPPVLIENSERPDHLFQQQGSKAVAGSAHIYNSLLLFGQIAPVSDVHPSGQAWGAWATARRPKTRASMKKNDERPTKRLRSSCRRSAWLTKRPTACCYWVRPEGGGGSRPDRVQSPGRESAGPEGRQGGLRIAVGAAVCDLDPLLRPRAACPRKCLRWVG